MVYLHLISARSNGQSQGHANFYLEYLVNGIAYFEEVAFGFWIVVFTFDIDPF